MGGMIIETQIENAYIHYNERLLLRFGKTITYDEYLNYVIPVRQNRDNAKGNKVVKVKYPDSVIVYAVTKNYHIQLLHIL